MKDALSDFFEPPFDRSGKRDIFMKFFKLNSTLKGCILAGIAAGAWGSQSFATRFLFGECTDEFNPYCVAFYRFLAGTLFLLFWQKCTTNDLPIHLSAVKKEWKNFLFLGFIGIAMEGLCQTASGAFTSSGRSALFGAGAPVFTLIFSFLFLKEKASLRKSLGIAVGMGGAILMLMTAGGDMYAGKNSMTGDLLALASGMFWGLYTVLLVNPTRKYGGRITASATMIFASILLLIPALISGGMWKIPSGTMLWGLLYLGLVASGIAIPCWNAAAKYLSAGALGAFGYLSLLLAVLLSIAGLKEKISIAFFAAFIMIIGSIAMTVQGASPEEEKKKEE